MDLVAHQDQKDGPQRVVPLQIQNAGQKPPQGGLHCGQYVVGQSCGVRAGEAVQGIQIALGIKGMIVGTVTAYLLTDLLGVVQVLLLQTQYGYVSSEQGVKLLLVLVERLDLLQGDVQTAQKLDAL